MNFLISYGAVLASHRGNTILMSDSTESFDALEPTY